MTSNPLKWREHVAIADMHSRLAAKILNALAQSDRVTADSLLNNIGKALECSQHAAVALGEARAEVERLYRRGTSIKGVVMHPAVAPLAVPLQDSAYCEWVRWEQTGKQTKPGGDGELYPIYRWSIGCKQHNAYMIAPPDRCHCGRQARIAETQPVRAS